MEQSKSISLVLAKLKIAYPYYFKKLTNEEFIGLIALYQENLSMYCEDTLLEAVKMLIKKSEYMPSIKEFIDACESVKENRKHIVLDKMKQCGYFKSFEEYDKTLKFIDTGIIPSWLLEDMKKYGYREELDSLAGNDSKLLGDSYDN